MWKTVYDSVQGTSHVLANVPCQDACRVIVENSDGQELLLIVCADGAGSATLAHIGSTVTCDELVRLVQENVTDQHFLCSIEKDAVQDWIHRVRIALEQRADDLGVSTRHLATTLLAALIGEESAAFLQIGDGAILTRHADDFRCVFWPQSGEFANTTYFLTDEAFEEHLQFERITGRVTECVMFTDGLERLVLRFGDKSVHRPFIEPMLSRMRESDSADEFFEPLRAFLSSDAINDRTDDDKTLILATRLCSNEDESVS